MKVNGTINPEALKAYGAQATERSQLIREPDNKQQSTTIAIRDKVDISSKVRMFQDIKEAALEAPDIRSDKVLDIQEKISTGTYRPDYTLVADKLLSSDINTRI